MAMECTIFANIKNVNKKFVYCICSSEFCACNCASVARSANFSKNFTSNFSAASSIRLFNSILSKEFVQSN